MKITVPTDRIIIEDANRLHDWRMGSWPGAKYVKLRNAWTFPASPFSAARISAWIKDEGIHVDSADERYHDLVNEFRTIQDDLKWKGDDAREAWKGIIEDRDKAPSMVSTKTIPWIHQGCAYSFIENKTAAYLALEMGTGKTLVTIMLIMDKLFDKVLIICPKSVLEVWEDEIRKHAPGHPYSVLTLTHGTSVQKAELMSFQMECSQAANRGQIVIVNYETAIQEKMQKALLSYKWGLTVLDEAHKIKKPSGVTSKFCAKLGQRSDRRLCLSGTPMPKNLLDTYAQCRFLDPGLFGTNIARMRKQYAVMGGFNNYEVVEFVNVERFERLFGYITFRVSKEVLNLLPLTMVNKYCEMSKGAISAYKELKNHFVTMVESGEVTAANALTKLMKFQQLTGGFLIDDEGVENEIEAGKAFTKEKLLEETIEAIHPSEKIVVFSVFKHDLKVIKRVAGKLDRRYGELSGDQNDTEGGQFPPDKDVLGAQIRAGGIGVNLTAARYEIFFSTGFSLGDYEQAASREHRGGQDRTVTIINLLCNNSIDTRIYDVIQNTMKLVHGHLKAIEKDDNTIVKDILGSVKRGESI